MVGGRLSNRWLGMSPGVVALIAIAGFVVPANGQAVHSGGSGHVAMSHPPAPRMPQMSGSRTQHPFPQGRQQQQPPVNQGRQQQSSQQQLQQQLQQQTQQQTQQVDPSRELGPPREPVGRMTTPGGGQFDTRGGGGDIRPENAGQGNLGQGNFGAGNANPSLPTATNVHPAVPHPPTTRRWPLPQGASESDRPPPGQCRVWLNGVPGSRQPAPTSCGQAAKMRTPNSSLIFGDDGPSRPQ
jgi:hypothetical protein